VAATVPGSLAISTVDEPDGLLAQAYDDWAWINDAHRQSDAAWSRIIDARCRRARLFDRYFSTARSTPAPWMFTEPPIGHCR